MILLADGGSTKVDWCLIDQGQKIKQVYTKGANPFFRSREEIGEELKSVLVPELKGYSIDKVYFYGAGCAFTKKNEIVRLAIADNINTSEIYIGSDLLAAAKGLCNNQEGIVAIMGTGSNSCFYNGQEILNNVSPLGYILGDEGSGAVLGKLLLGACLKNQLTEELKEKFLTQFELTPAIILDNVYRQPMANRFLANLSVFLIENIEDQTIHKLVYNAFKEFFLRNIMQYDYVKNKIHFTGSIAFHYQELLKEVAKDLNIEITTIIKSPMEGLIRYHSHLE